MMTLFTALSAEPNTYLRFNLSIFLFSAFTERLGGCLYKCGCVVKVVCPNVNNAYKAKSRKYRGIFEEHSPEKIRQVRKKVLVSTSRTYASPKGTGPGVRRSKGPLAACHTRRKCSIETTQNSVKGRFRYKV